MRAASKPGFELKMIEESMEPTAGLSSRHRHWSSSSDNEDESVDEELMFGSNPFATSSGSLLQAEEDLSPTKILPAASANENAPPAAAGVAGESPRPGQSGGSNRSESIDIGGRNPGIRAGKKGGHRLQRSWSNDSSREEAWMRRKDQFDVEEKKGRAVSRSVSDCGDTAHRARILTDADLEELRGCIDLGFCFNCDEDRRLCNTFPALDLYYAINRQYNDCKSKLSPVSTQGSSFGRSSGGGSPSSPLCDAWTISSPGDNSQDVKTRLRHWAQAVACSVRHSCS